MSGRNDGRNDAEGVRTAHSMDAADSMELLNDLVEAIAQRVAALLRDEQPSQSTEWVDAQRVADEYGVSRDYVYAHAAELGAVPLGERGDGRRPRLRFDLATVAAALTDRRESGRPQINEIPANRSTSHRQRARPSDSGVELLPIRGRSEAA